MKKAAVFVASFAILLVLMVSLWRNRAPVPAVEAPRAMATANPPTATPPSAEIVPPAGVGAQSTPSAEEAASTRPAFAVEDHATALDMMRDAMVTYDPANLPVIARYLAHEDEALRAAALDNMLQMGEKAAAPLLRAAAKTAAPAEAVALLEAADFLELPSGAEFLRKRKAAASGGGRTTSQPARSREPAPAPESDLITP